MTHTSATFSLYLCEKKGWEEKVSSEYYCLALPPFLSQSLLSFNLTERNMKTKTEKRVERWNKVGYLTVQAREGSCSLRPPALTVQSGLSPACFRDAGLVAR